MSCNIPPSLLIPYRLILPGEKIQMIMLGSNLIKPNKMFTFFTGSGRMVLTPTKPYITIGTDLDFVVGLNQQWVVNLNRQHMVNLNRHWMVTLTEYYSMISKLSDSTQEILDIHKIKDIVVF